MCSVLYVSLFFFFNDTATTEIYTLSLHDALPISSPTGSSASNSTRPRGSSSRPSPCPHPRGRGRRAGGTSTCRATTDRKSTRLNSSHTVISYAVFCLKKKKKKKIKKTKSKQKEEI